MPVQVSYSCRFYTPLTTPAGYLIYLYEVKLVGLFWDLPKIVSWWWEGVRMKKRKKVIILQTYLLGVSRENLCLVVLTCCSLLQYRTLCVQGEEARGSQGRLCRPCGARSATDLYFLE